MGVFCCVLCKTEYTKFSNTCICGGKFCIIQIPKKLLKKRRIKSASELISEKNFSKSIPGYEFLGELPSEWSCMISGPPGHGKSTFSMKLCSTIAQKSRACLYWSFEEGHSESLKRKLRQNNINGKNLLFTQADDLEDFLEDLEIFHPKCFVIDSLNDACLDTKDIKSLKKNKCIGIYLVHQTKDDKYKGDSSLGHEIDIHLEIKDFTVKVKKNRFGMKDATFKFLEDSVKPIIQEEKENE